MAIFNISKAKKNFPRLVRRVEAGEEVVISRAGVPVAKLVSCEIATPRCRQPGLMRGEIWISDDFDAPLPESIAAAFRGERP